MTCRRFGRAGDNMARRAREAGLINPNMPGAATTDSDILGALLAHGAADSTLEQAALELKSMQIAAGLRPAMRRGIGPQIEIGALDRA